ncbi:uracil-DNA glycosylase [Cryobacterium sp. TMT1-21]|uniref:Uracil-DNA glycosylase n=1 Tax=Cryobacterium shii TaxID=1259235 RepID=A0AAQ2C4A0_9MICO|nr:MULTISPECIES: uracil-DNA glycosylase [Cryobacterium]TFC42487.1 uracil-DNA glycosylase [Cryobacterium shii]TFC80819.1 uracil-DNA glycosylase [Cryobacterium sp. TmT2-59]TFD13253.1 uracil-DNA glycosylase [Cryobacterium sp. TMT1-21]TFD28476.1 uracil-DNA glycosylase [Cryobacterium sp. TMT2-23]TFD35446.1 uracil-DNA glycosylase [Cryobacterium sp. TMT2-10]
MPFTLQALARSRAMDPGWAAALEPVGPEIDAMAAFLQGETRAGRPWLPAPENVFRAFAEPFDAVRVLIVGQDPYPTPGHPIGLAFAVDPHVRPLPRSLQNICRELHEDVGVTAADGDLTPWSRQGVLLLNRVLTVQQGVAGAHRRNGWEAVSEQAIRALVARDRPLVAILWGRDAATLKPLLGDTPMIESAHPSPLSARRGFFGSRPFSRANEQLRLAGAAPVDWSLG